MTYEETGTAIVSRQAALHEINRHKALWVDFIAEYGHKEEYLARDVLDWLGY